MNLPTKEELKAQKEELGKSSVVTDPEKAVKKGYSWWIENGVYFQAPKVNGKLFKGHDYSGGFWDRGIRDCKCGCFMLSSSSGGPVDPFGPCPLNPRKPNDDLISPR